MLKKMLKSSTDIVGKVVYGMCCIADAFNCAENRVACTLLRPTIEELLLALAPAIRQREVLVKVTMDALRVSTHSSITALVSIDCGTAEFQKPSNVYVVALAAGKDTPTRVRQIAAKTKVSVLFCYLFTSPDGRCLLSLRINENGHTFWKCLGQTRFCR